jgi:hypothetical protein
VEVVGGDQVRGDRVLHEACPAVGGQSHTLSSFRLNRVMAQPRVRAASAEDGMALNPVPSRRSMGSASATMSAFWESVKTTGPMVVSPLLASLLVSCRNDGVFRWTANS